MVLDICLKGFDTFYCTYSGFNKFRCQILRGWNEELGVLYELYIFYLFDFYEIYERESEVLKKYSYFYNDINNRKFLYNKIQIILNEYDKPYNEGMKILAYHSDGDGIITPEESILILKSFDRVNPDKFEESDKDNIGWYRESYYVWKKMLAYAIENNEIIEFG